uniref:Uncharacterized protein n=1 Tax=Anguilla anguilla TaxID=7936 RepID=A0A0E9UWZ7_ANGAN
MLAVAVYLRNKRFLKTDRLVRPQAGVLSKTVVMPGRAKIRAET